MFISRKLAQVLALSLVLVAPRFSYAAPHNVKWEPKETIHIAAGEILDGHLYAVGKEVVIEGVVKGDLVVGAGKLTINGQVLGDVSGVVGEVDINGIVQNDVRLLAKHLHLGESCHIVGDLLVKATSLKCGRTSGVSGNLTCEVDHAEFAGSIGQELSGSFSTCDISGTIQGNVEIVLIAQKARDEKAKSLLPSLTKTNFSLPSSEMAATNNAPAPIVNLPLSVQHFAKIGGSLKYTAPEKAAISEAAQIAGGVEFTKQKHQGRIAKRLEPTYWNQFVAHFIGLAFMSLLIVYLRPSWSSSTAETVFRHPFKNLLSAAGGLVIGPVVLALLFAVCAWTAKGLSTLHMTDSSNNVYLFATIGTLMVFVGSAFVLCFAGPAVVGLGVGRLFLGCVSVSADQQKFIPVLLGTAMIASLSTVPIIGPLLMLLFCCLGFGAMVTSALTRQRQSAGASANAHFLTDPAPVHTAANSRPYRGSK